MTKHNVSNSSNIKKYLATSLFSLIMVGLNPDFNNIGIVWWLVVGLSLVAMFITIEKNKIPLINMFTIWQSVFLFIAIASYFWALNTSYVIEHIKLLIVNISSLCLLSCVIQSDNDIINLLKIIVGSILVNAIYILSSIDLSLIGKVEIGVDTLGIRWNANSIGMMMAIGTLIILMILSIESRRLNKIMYTILSILFVAIALFTGSRKAIFFIVFGCSLYVILLNKNRIVSNIIKIILLLTIVYTLVMNVPELYNILGVRIEGLIAQITGKGVVDSSTKLRMNYIEYGQMWFVKKPLFGYGLNNYRELLGREIGRYTYAHNNYIEMMVNLGIIGTLIYYLGYIYILKNSIKSLFKNNDYIYILILILTITILIGQYGFVAYSDFLINLILCLSFSVIKVRRIK